MNHEHRAFNSPSGYIICVVCKDYLGICEKTETKPPMTFGMKDVYKLRSTGSSWRERAKA